MASYGNLELAFAEAHRQTLAGGNGAVYESGTTAVTGSFYAIQAMEAAVFTSLTATNWAGDSTASLPLPSGAIIYGDFTAFQLTSGKVVAYKAARA